MCMNTNMHTHESDAQRIEGSAEPGPSTKVTVTLPAIVYSFVIISEILERDLLSRGRIRKELHSCERYMFVVL